MKTKHNTIIIVCSVLFGITMHALGYFVFSLFGAIFTDYTSVITEPNWFMSYSILCVIPNVALGIGFYDDYSIL